MKRRDWKKYLHTLRKCEFQIAFATVPEGTFERALELGAGDGFQSHLLQRVAERLVVTEYHLARFDREIDKDVTGVICDAECVGELFRSNTFDLIFSSNVLEHLPDPARAIGGMWKILKDDGVMVHVVPSRFAKVALFIGHYFEVSRVVLRRVLSGGGRLAGVPKPGNNPKLRRVHRSRFSRFLWPPIHGVSDHHLGEFVDWGVRKWSRRFEESGFRVIRRLKGPVTSGYGFGWDRARTVLERLGFGGSNIFVLAKSGFTPSTQHWTK